MIFTEWWDSSLFAMYKLQTINQPANQSINQSINPSGKSQTKVKICWLSTISRDSHQSINGSNIKCWPKVAPYSVQTRVASTNRQELPQQTVWTGITRQSLITSGKLGKWVRAPDRTNTQGLTITEENMLPLQWHLQIVTYSSLLG